MKDGAQFLPLKENLKDVYKVTFFAACTVALVLSATLMKPHGYGFLAGGLTGLFVHWKKTLIAQMRFEINDVKNIEFYIHKWGYRPTTQGNYQHRAIRILRFDSQDIKIENLASSVQITGPVFLLRLLRRKLAAL